MGKQGLFFDIGKKGFRVPAVARGYGGQAGFRVGMRPEAARYTGNGWSGSDQVRVRQDASDRKVTGWRGAGDEIGPCPILVTSGWGEGSRAFAKNGGAVAVSRTQ
jgi:hypothetical protein